MNKLKKSNKYNIYFIFILLNIIALNKNKSTEDLIQEEIINSQSVEKNDNIELNQFSSDVLIKKPVLQVDSIDNSNNNNKFIEIDSNKNSNEIQEIEIISKKNMHSLPKISLIESITSDKKLENKETNILDLKEDLIMYCNEAIHKRLIEEKNNNEKEILYKINTMYVIIGVSYCAVALFVLYNFLFNSNKNNSQNEDE